ncbi:MAG: hypothetical protein IPG75_22605 [Gemmatimonadetes bacterium]|nr:hypothetical protein [Gemmatimonadota bacterium]
MTYRKIQWRSAESVGGHLGDNKRRLGGVEGDGHEDFLQVDAGEEAAAEPPVGNQQQSMHHEGDEDRARKLA